MLAVMHSKIVDISYLFFFLKKKAYKLYDANLKTVQLLHLKVWEKGHKGTSVVN